MDANAIRPGNDSRERGSATVDDSAMRRRAQAVRHFNRFYTRHIGALHEHLQRSAFSLTEVRVMHELARGQHQTAAALARNLGLDSGYLSRLLASFEKRALISRRPSEFDARQSLLSLTEAGRAAWLPLDAAAIDEVSGVLSGLAAYSQDQLISAMNVIERLLDERRGPRAVTLRAPRPGEFSGLVSRQAQWFATGHGWDHTFEASLAQHVGQFVERNDARREAWWVAEQTGTVVGSALIDAASGALANLRMMFVEPDVQRLGVGTQLMNEALRFAKHAGYRALATETVSALDGARRFFSRAGFARVSAAPERRFGQDVVVERWERAV